MGSLFVGGGKDLRALKPSDPFLYPVTYTSLPVTPQPMPSLTMSGTLTGRVTMGKMK